MGFEPTDRVTPVNALAGRPIRPLWHFSASESMGRSSRSELPIGRSPHTRRIVSLTGGTVAERTIAPALKADDPQGSEGSNPSRSAHGRSARGGPAEPPQLRCTRRIPCSASVRWRRRTPQPAARGCVVPEPGGGGASADTPRCNPRGPRRDGSRVNEPRSLVGRRGDVGVEAVGELAAPVTQLLGRRRDDVRCPWVSAAAHRSPVRLLGHRRGYAPADMRPSPR